MSVRRTIAEADLATLNVAEFCRAHGLSRDRFYAIRRRYEAEGDAGLEARSRAPKRVANRTEADIEDAMVVLRKELVELGVDAGPATIRVHLPGRLPAGAHVPSEATIWRVLTRRGFVTPDRSKSPKPSLRRFAADRANECWQIDDTEWVLANGQPVKIINIIDDCTRVCIASTAVRSCTGTEALDTFAAGAAEWGWPERFLSDNAPAFRHTLATALAELGIAARHSRPYHPQTQGKVERFHQTLKNKYLASRDPAATIEDLQDQLDRFRSYYNHQRPHRAIDRATPASKWAATAKTGPKAKPLTAPPTVWTGVAASGAVHPRQNLTIAIGAAHNGAKATTIITGRAAHVFINGALIRALTIDPTRRRQPLYTRPGRPRTRTNP